MLAAEDVLTEYGVEYIEAFMDEYQSFKGDESKGKFFRDIAKKYDLEAIESTNSFYGKAGVMPFEFSNLGPLLQEDIAEEKDFILKTRYTEPYSMSFQFDSGRHRNQNFNEAKTWLETQGEEAHQYLTPVVAFDADDGRWILMEEIDLALPLHHDVISWVHELFEDMGWDSHDAEIGLHGKRWRTFDYGKFSPLDRDWSISDEEVLESEIAVHPSQY